MEMSTQSKNLCLTKSFIKDRIQNDNYNLFGQSKECSELTEIILKTINFGESNSVFLIGKRKSGKTTLLSHTIRTLFSQQNIKINTQIVYLNGIIDTDDRITLKSITNQLQLENRLNSNVSGSFAENLAFLLECLKSGDRKTSKNVIFIIDELDLFCRHHNQTLLYNLFDIAQSNSAPICVIASTNRLDVVELLEKRVKSRFSHRQIFIYPCLKDYNKLIEKILLIPTNECNNDYCEKFQIEKYINRFDKEWICKWNKIITEIFQDEKVCSCVERTIEAYNSLYTIKSILLQFTFKINSNDFNSISTNNLKEVITARSTDHKLQLLQDLSVLEICLLIAIKQHIDIYDREPFNFRMIYRRLRKFESRRHYFDHSTALKCFQQLKNCEIIVPADTHSIKNQLEFQLHKLLLTNRQIECTISNYVNLPTDISQWAMNSSLN